MRKKFISGLILLFSIANCCRAQICYGGKPFTFSDSCPQTIQQCSIPEISMPLVSNHALMLEEQADSSHLHKTYRYGKAISTNITPFNSGRWDDLPDGGRLWRLEISSDSAYAIQLYYSNFYIPPGAQLFIYNSDTTDIFGALVYQNNPNGGKYASRPMRGNKIAIEYYSPHGVTAYPAISIEKVGHAYKNIFNKTHDQLGTSQSCEINVNCSEGFLWESEKRSVVMLSVLTQGDYSGFCSGAMVNNTQQDGKPYLLTAFHCFDDDESCSLSFAEQNALQVVFIFNYESVFCDGTSEPTPSNLQTTVGATVKTFDVQSDFVLLELNSVPPVSYNVYMAGWDRNDPFTRVVSIHHPAGDIKKISIAENDPNSDGYPFTCSQLPGTHWKSVWTNGTTEGGSSGAPLFNVSHRIVGQLHGGLASCILTNEPDYFGKFSTSWGLGLSQYLDPVNNGLFSLNGINLNDIPPPSSPYAHCQINLLLENIQSLPSGMYGGENSIKIVNTTTATGTNIELIAGDMIEIEGEIIINSDLTASIDSDIICPFYNKKGHDERDNNEANETMNLIESNEVEMAEKQLSSHFVYPNPNEGQFTLVINDKNQKNELNIYNLLGELVCHSTITNNRIIVDLSAKPRGIYIVKVVSERGEVLGVEKVVVQ